METRERQFEQEPDLGIETIRGSGGGEASYCPERGGIITSLKLRGQEILYLDEDTLKDRAVNVKGGIPILFPNAGPIKGEGYPGLKQHGFAREAVDWVAVQDESGRSFMETLKANAETKKVYPYDFRFSTGGKFEEDGSFTLLQEVENLEAGKDMPLSMGLHPYFKVPREAMGNIKFDFEGGTEVERSIEQWSKDKEVKTVKIDNPRVKDPKAKMRITIPSLGTLTIDASPEYKKIWVWSMVDKDFICIEPVMRNAGGLENEPELISPGKTFSSRVNIKLL